MRERQPRFLLMVRGNVAPTAADIGEDFLDLHQLDTLIGSRSLETGGTCCLSPSPWLGESWQRRCVAR
jgi:hypothetical protein